MVYVAAYVHGVAWMYGDGLGWVWSVYEMWYMKWGMCMEWWCGCMGMFYRISVEWVGVRFVM